MIDGTRTALKAGEKQCLQELKTYCVFAKTAFRRLQITVLPRLRSHKEQRVGEVVRANPQSTKQHDSCVCRPPGDRGPCETLR